MRSKVNRLIHDRVVWLCVQVLVASCLDLRSGWMMRSLTWWHCWEEMEPTWSKYAYSLICLCFLAHVRRAALFSPTPAIMKLCLAIAQKKQTKKTEAPATFSLPNLPLFPHCPIKNVSAVKSLSRVTSGMQGWFNTMWTTTVHDRG